MHAAFHDMQPLQVLLGHVVYVALKKLACLVVQLLAALFSAPAALTREKRTQHVGQRSCNYAVVLLVPGPC